MPIKRAHSPLYKPGDEYSEAMKKHRERAKPKPKKPKQPMPIAGRMGK